MIEQVYLTPSQVGAALSPPRTAERVRQLCRQGTIPYTPMVEGSHARARTKYLIRREDMEVFRDRVDKSRPRGRPHKRPAGPKVETDKAWIKVREAAETLGLSGRTVRKLIVQGQIPTQKMGGSILIPKAWLYILETEALKSMMGTEDPATTTKNGA